MFYKMIENARNRWYASAESTVTSMMDYIESKGMLRDEQINAIKTYLFLKIYCESRPLEDRSKILPLRRCSNIPV